MLEKYLMQNLQENKKVENILGEENSIMHKHSGK